MSGSIAVQNFPSTWEVPGVYVASSPAGSAAGENNIGLLFGQMAVTGATATAATPILGVNQTNVNALCGTSSMIAMQYAMAYQNNPNTTWYVCPLVDAGGSTASTNVMTITGPATASGSIAVSINNVPVSVAVVAGQTNLQIAANMVSAINSAGLPVVAGTATGVVTLTSLNKGFTAGNIVVQVNPYGASQGQSMPAGVTVTNVYTPGATDPDLATALINCQNLGAAYTCNPYATSTDLGETSAEEQTQWLPTNDRFGQVFTASQGSVAALVTTGALYNDPYLSIMSVPTATLQSPYLWASAYTGAAAASLDDDPTLPLTGDILVGIAPPVSPTSNFAPTDRNTLYGNGIASYTVQGGFVYIDLPITTYEKNSSGIDDPSYLLANTPATLALVSTTFRNRLATDFSKKKILPDGNAVSGFNNVVTPTTIKAHVCAYYADLANDGIVGNTQAFNKGVSVQINSSNPNQVRVFAPITLASPLEQIVVNLVFSFS